MKGGAVVYAIIGFFAGVLIAESFGSYVLNAIAGAVLGVVFARLMQLERRIRKLESSRQESQPEPQAVSGWGRPADSEKPAEPAIQSTSPWLDTPGGTASLKDPAPSGDAILEQAREAEAKHDHRTDPEWSDPPRVAGPSLLQVLLGKVSEWLTSGNVPIKVGVIISFIGVAFLLKYAVDRRLLVISLEFRFRFIRISIA